MPCFLLLSGGSGFRILQDVRAVFQGEAVQGAQALVGHRAFVGELHPAPVLPALGPGGQRLPAGIRAVGIARADEVAQYELICSRSAKSMGSQGLQAGTPARIEPNAYQSSPECQASRLSVSR